MKADAARGGGLEKFCHWLFTQEANFVAAAGSVGAIPNTQLPEFAFVGRSNVGKSSLINALVNRRKLVRTSKSPGCTKEILFFNVAKEFMLVDLPGYGYAKVSHSMQNKWSKFIEYYLAHSPNLKRVFLLIDGRHPLKELDAETAKYLKSKGIPFDIVLTKLDKAAVSPITNETFPYNHIFLTSSKERAGIKEIAMTISEELL